VVKGDFKLFSL